MKDYTNDVQVVNGLLAKSNQDKLIFSSVYFSNLLYIQHNIYSLCTNLYLKWNVGVYIIDSHIVMYYIIFLSESLPEKNRCVPFLTIRLQMVNLITNYQYYVYY